MKAQDPTKGLHGPTFFLFSLLMILLLMAASSAGPVLAKKDMQAATEGDPGDGNLSPESLQVASGSSAYSGMDGGMSSINLPPTDESREYWLVPLPGIPGQVTWFLLPRNAGDLFRWRGVPVPPQRERRCTHAR